MKQKRYKVTTFLEQTPEITVVFQTWANWMRSNEGGVIRATGLEPTRSEEPVNTNILSLCTAKIGKSNSTCHPCLEHMFKKTVSSPHQTWILTWAIHNTSQAKSFRSRILYCTTPPLFWGYLGEHFGCDRLLLNGWQVLVACTGRLGWQAIYSI